MAKFGPFFLTAYKRELRLLVDAGYDALDLEELIHDNQFRENCVQEIMADFGVY